MVTDVYQLPGDHMNLDLPILGDDLPEGEAFPTAGQHRGSEQSEVIQSTSTASAPLRRKPRAPRVMAIDTVMELRNKDLSDWNANYLENMDAAVQAKSQALVARQAKKDAEHFLWGGGIGGIADQFLGLSVPNPFDMFIGDNLFALITGVDRKKTPNAKRDRDSGIDEETQKESRRVRQKTGEPDGELGRGLEDEGFFLPAGDEGDVPRDEVEIPRDAATALDDHQISSAMPWNNSASVRLSSAIPRSGRAGMMDRGRSGSRTRSPLHGRGPPLNSEALRNLDSDANFSYAGDEFALPGPSSPPTVIGGPVPQARDTLPVEGGNFLDFVTDAIVEKRNRVQATFDPMSDILQADAAADIDDITFEELLPPRENSKVVACHGLMMVLSLGMKGMLDVQQREGLGDINVKLTLKAKASQIVEISDGEESEESDGVEIVEEKNVVEGEDVVPSAETGHFEDQFQAGHAAADENMDNHNSLYDD
jgi:meiotic recombination protein REC8